MARDTEKLLAEALSLPLDARAELATKLLRSLDEEEVGPEDYEKAWGAEIRRRIQEIDSGAVATLSVEAAMKIIDSDDPDPAR